MLARLIEPPDETANRCVDRGRFRPTWRRSGGGRNSGATMATHPAHPTRLLAPQAPAENGRDHVAPAATEAHSVPVRLAKALHERGHLEVGQKGRRPPYSLNQEGYSGFGGYAASKWLRCWGLAVTTSPLGPKSVSGTADTRMATLPGVSNPHFQTSNRK